MTNPLVELPGVVYRPAHLGEAYTQDGVLPLEGLVHAMLRSLRENAARIAVSEAARQVSYAELDALSDGLAGSMLRLGLRPLDAVLFQLPNSIDLVVGFLACLKARLIPVCTLVGHRESEIHTIGKMVQAAAHFIPGGTQFDFVSFSRRAREAVPSLKLSIVAGETAGDPTSDVYSLRTLANQPLHATNALPPLEAHDPWQVAIYQLSGGTTGTPKIIPRFHNDYLCNLQHLIARVGHRQDDRILVFTPMMHNAPFICTWASALLIGAETVVMDGIEPVAMVRTILARRPTMAMASEAMLSRVRGLPEFSGLWSSFRLLLAGRGGKMLEEETGVRTVPFFGMTEGMICFGAPDDPAELRHGTVGYPICSADAFAILAPQSEEELPDGQVGELVIRGPYTIHGYLHAPERNREAFTSTGFYRTGDLMSRVVVDGKPCLRFHGRLKDVIDRGGEKINCEDVERHLLLSSRVTAAAVVPMPDRQYGQKACAYIVTNPVGYPLQLQEVRDHLRKVGLAKFKWPERLELVEALPLTNSGKPDKAPLRDLIQAKVLAEWRLAGPEQAIQSAAKA